MDCARSIKIILRGSGPITLRVDLEHRKSYALLTCSKISCNNNNTTTITTRQRKRGVQVHRFLLKLMIPGYTIVGQKSNERNWQRRTNEYQEKKIKKLTLRRNAGSFTLIGTWADSSEPHA